MSAALEFNWEERLAAALAAWQWLGVIGDVRVDRRGACLVSVYGQRLRLDPSEAEAFLYGLAVARHASRQWSKDAAKLQGRKERLEASARRTNSRWRRQRLAEQALEFAAMLQGFVAPWRTAGVR